MTEETEPRKKPNHQSLEVTHSNMNDSDDARLEAIFLKAIDTWLGKTRGGYNFWRIGRIMAAADTAAYFHQHMLTTPLFRSRKSLHRGSFKLKNIPGLNLEFGVAAGTSLNRIADAFPHEPVYGFDSFEGLPESWRADYQQGHFAQRPPDVRQNIELVIGWFHETLPLFLEAHPEPISYLHIDCDLYSSTKTIFDLAGKRIVPGSVIVFDEYFNYPGWREHEHKAFQEFAAEVGLKYRYAGAVRSNKQVVVIVE